MDKTYNQFRSNPNEAPAYLRTHYEDGRMWTNKPTAKLALAAWRAGRDSMITERAEA